jgi:mRNA deadenylase 3'-5' endonuclease subunit Ccr4
MAFTAVTWNILADPYIRPQSYPDTDPARLDPAWRRPAVLTRMAQLNADVLCLQEVEPVLFEAVRMLLGGLGYDGRFALKGERHEGCAVFFRTALFSLLAEHTMHFADGGAGQRQSDAPTGCLAVVLILEHEGRRLGVAGTHLKWDPPGTPSEERRGLRQAKQLVADLPRLDPACTAWLACGDFNAMPEDDVVRTFRSAGYADAFAALPTAWTCNSDHRPRRIDFLMSVGPLRSELLSQPPLDGATPLPCIEEPSDHRPVAARFEWVQSG